MEKYKSYEIKSSQDNKLENGNEITMAFKENYYQKYDIFMIDESRQQCQVVSRPIRKRDDYWTVQVRLIDNDYSSILDDSACEPGMTTTWKSVAVNLMSGLIRQLIMLKSFLIAGKLN